MRLLRRRHAARVAPRFALVVGMIGTSIGAARRILRPLGTASCPNSGRLLASPSVAKEENSLTNFGLLIAYVLPGFTALQGFPVASHVSGGWGTAGADPNPSLTTFLSGTVEALAAGLTVSTVRWLLIDTIHHHTGIRCLAWDFALLEKRVAAFGYLIQIHYRYYKFYANMVVALVWAYATRDYALGRDGAVDLVLAVLFFFASRDALGKYYERAGKLLGPEPTAGGPGARHSLRGGHEILHRHA
jgi:hypothetical protein